MTLAPPRVPSSLDALTFPASPGAGGDDRAPARFRVDAALGSGAFGIVYRSHDCLRGTDVALKALHRADPDALYGFKQEFRALSDLRHPNVVEPYELIADEHGWFVAMELIDGIDFFQWTQGLKRRSAVEREARLRHGFGQLAEALATLHAAGHLHRDLKPSNVLVTREDRVVLVDFGLVLESYPLLSERANRPAGSPPYMAPEQAAGARPTEASDHYSLGVMLFEALTGRRPFTGPATQVLVQKQISDAPSVHSFIATAPPDLAEVCDGLLRRRPDQRPPGSVIRARLARKGSTEQPVVVRAPSEKPLDRVEEIEMLTRAFGSVRSGRTEVALITGEPRSGKTALIDRFLRRIRGRRAVLLNGRCSLRESLPRRGLDGVGDALGRYLANLHIEEARALLPRDVASLLALFPVLGRAPALAPYVSSPASTPAPELERRGGHAFSGLLHAIGRRRPLVVAIDDLQWIDAAGTELLQLLLAPPAPPMLLVLSCRTGEWPADIRSAIAQLREAPVRELHLEATRGPSRAVG